MKKCYQPILVLITIFLLSACNQAAQNQPEPQSTAPMVATTTSTPAPTNIPTFFNTATPTHEPVEVSYIGTPLPVSDQVISKENIHNLVQVGQWGYGAIVGTAFTPDGEQFIVSTVLGFTIYEMNDLQSPPKWVPFKSGINHDWITLDSSGQYLRLTSLVDYHTNEFSFLELASGKQIEEPVDVEWDNSVLNVDFYSPLIIDSPNNLTRTVLYHEHEPSEKLSGFIDYRDGRISVYDNYDIKLQSFGTDDNPAIAFSYSPDGKLLLLGFGRGNIQLWNIQSQEIVFDAWHFNDYWCSLTFASNNRYALVHHPQLLEIRKADSGVLRSRLYLTHETINPADDNILAYLDFNNNIKLFDIDKSNDFLTIPFPDDELRAMRFSSDGKYIVTSSNDEKIRLWNANTGEFLHYFEQILIDPFDPYPHYPNDPSDDVHLLINDFAFVEGTNDVFGFASGYTASLFFNWNINSGAIQYVVYMAPCNKEDFQVDQNREKIYCRENIYDYNTGELLEEGEYSNEKHYPLILASSNDLYFSYVPEVYYVGISIIDATTDKQIRAIPLIDRPTLIMEIRKLIVSEDGTRLYVITSTGAIQIYQIVD